MNSKLLRTRPGEQPEPVRDPWTGEMLSFENRQQARTYGQQAMTATGNTYTIYWVPDDKLPRMELVEPKPIWRKNA